ncbi:Type 1 glutamine amidotransferase-like domain-containing protein [Aquipuribacter sp. MA13-6]|uniref:Type 1 glutamine amidotransferase-like domain-containing protein n=1 Tax=unclassified Aquipuribacter TaxID=2635084 RepID=UPI003EEDEDDA
MTGPLLLQGGAEMQPSCREMDLQLLDLAPDGAVVVLLGAATPGADHDRAAGRARRYYGALTSRPVVVAPHPQVDMAACVEAVLAAGAVVLPGGSPSRLQGALQDEDARLGGLLLQLHQDGVALSGASAGAMVLCARTVLPERRRVGGPAVVDGLGLLPGLALVHDDGGDGGWVDPDDPAGPRWGLPEAGGVLLVHDGLRAVGQGSARLVVDGAEHAIGRSTRSLGGLLGR